MSPTPASARSQTLHFPIIPDWLESPVTWLSVVCWSSSVSWQKNCASESRITWSPMSASQPFRRPYPHQSVHQFPLSPLFVYSPLIPTPPAHLPSSFSSEIWNLVKIWRKMQNLEFGQNLTKDARCFLQKPPYYTLVNIVVFIRFSPFLLDPGIPHVPCMPDGQICIWK